MSGIAWKPSREMVEGSNVRAFLQAHGLSSYEALLRRATEDPEWFWPAFFQAVDLKFRRPYRQVLDLSRGKPWARWFVGGLLNYTEWALDRWPQDRLALIWEGEDGEVRRYTFGSLQAEVNRFSNALRALGVREGDRVGIYLPMLPETAVALLAVSRIGAIAVPIFSGFGLEPARVRLKDAEAKALITADGFYRRGKVVPLKETADEAAQGVDSLEAVVVVRRTGTSVPWREGRDHDYGRLVEAASEHYEPLAYDSDAPFMIIYTSGTTGRPKGTLHVHAGFPIKAAQDMWFLFDVKPSDRIFWLTDLGWMMGPWLITGGLILGAAIVLYEGAPDYPAPDRLWQLVEAHEATILGITPTLIRALMAHGAEAVDVHPMPSLRIIGSTGEPWNPEPWHWTLRHVGKGRAPIVNYSGGTEISGGILGCVVTRPLKPTSFNTPVPGVDADVWDEEGRPVRGRVGYLVVKAPNPGMTRGFWRDPERYLQTYWSRYPDVWYHGDLALIDEEGFWVHPGPCRRCAEGRGEARGARGDRVRPRRTLGRPGGRRDRRAGPGKGRSPGGVRDPSAGRPAFGASCPGTDRNGSARHRQTSGAQSGALCA